MAQMTCSVCGRPAVTTIRRIVPGEPPRLEHLCEVHAAQASGRRPAFGGPMGGGSLFDDFFSRFFDEELQRGPARRAAPGRQTEQVDITRYFSDSTNELLQRAAGRAMEWGSGDLNTEHLLYSALEDEVVRRVLGRVDADPGSIAAQIEEEAGGGGRTETTPSLTPDAKRALLGAYEESRALGASYIGPEHVLLALAGDEEGGPDSCSRASGSRTPGCGGRWYAAWTPRARLVRKPAPRPRSTSTAATSPRPPGRVSWIP